MAIFLYQAYGARGEFAQGRIEAVSQDAAGDMLWAQGLTPYSMRALDGTAKRWWQRELFEGTGSSPTQLAAFTRDFATLNTAEIPLDDALRIMGDRATAPGLRTIASSLLANVLDGVPLSEAMHKQSAVFPADYVSAVRAGEIGGTLTQVLEEMADLLDRRMEVRARIRSALVYPTVLIVLAIVSLSLIAGVLVPGIAPIFAESGKPMPAVVELILAAQARWAELAAGLGAVGAATAAAVLIALRRPQVRVALDRRKLRLPIFGDFILNKETARFARSLGTLLRSGVPLLQAATSARAVVANQHLTAGIDRAVEAVREGSSLHRALQQETTLPPVALRMISVGEEAGKLDRMLLRVAAIFEQQTQRSIDRFMTILTQALTIGIAVMVGSLIMTLMSAILSMNELAFR